MLSFFVLQVLIDTLKLDKSLVWDAVGNDKSSVLVYNLVQEIKKIGSAVTMITERMEHWYYSEHIKI